MSSDFPTHSEIGEENVRQYMQRRCRERAEYGDAREETKGEQIDTWLKQAKRGTITLIGIVPCYWYLMRMNK